MQPLELIPPRQSFNGGDAPNVFFGIRWQAAVDTSFIDPIMKKNWHKDQDKLETSRLLQATPHHSKNHILTFQINQKQNSPNFEDFQQGWFSHQGGGIPIQVELAIGSALGCWENLQERIASVDLNYV